MKYVLKSGQLFKARKMGRKEKGREREVGEREREVGERERIELQQWPGLATNGANSQQHNNMLRFPLLLSFGQGDQKCSNQ